MDYLRARSVPHIIVMLNKGKPTLYSRVRMSQLGPLIRCIVYRSAKVSLPIAFSGGVNDEKDIIIIVVENIPH